MHEPVSSFAAFIGIDWADRKHDVCLSTPGSATLERSVLEHQPLAIQKWASALRQRFPEGPIAVCLELSQGPIVSALLEHDFFVIFPVNPSTLAKYRRAFTESVNALETAGLRKLRGKGCRRSRDREVHSHGAGGDRVDAYLGGR